MTGSSKSEQKNRHEAQEGRQKPTMPCRQNKSLDRPAMVQETSGQREGCRTGVVRGEAYVEGEVHQRQHIEEHELRHTGLGFRV